MHPILARLERLAAYLALWGAVGILVGAVLTRYRSFFDRLLSA